MQYIMQLLTLNCILDIDHRVPIMILGIKVETWIIQALSRDA